MSRAAAFARDHKITFVGVSAKGLNRQNVQMTLCILMADAYIIRLALTSAAKVWYGMLMVWAAICGSAAVPEFSTCASNDNQMRYAPRVRQVVIVKPESMFSF